MADDVRIFERIQEFERTQRQSRITKEYVLVGIAADMIDLSRMFNVVQKDYSTTYTVALNSAVSAAPGLAIFFAKLATADAGRTATIMRWCGGLVATTLLIDDPVAFAVGCVGCEVCLVGWYTALDAERVTTGLEVGDAAGHADAQEKATSVFRAGQIVGIGVGTFLLVMTKSPQDVFAAYVAFLVFVAWWFHDWTPRPCPPPPPPPPDHQRSHDEDDDQKALLWRRVAFYSVLVALPDPKIIYAVFLVKHQLWGEGGMALVLGAATAAAIVGTKIGRRVAYTSAEAPAMKFAAVVVVVAQLVMRSDMQAWWAVEGDADRMWGALFVPVCFGALAVLEQITNVRAALFGDPYTYTVATALPLLGKFVGEGGASVLAWSFDVDTHPTRTIQLLLSTAGISSLALMLPT